jgi:hypothetical protein
LKEQIFDAYRISLTHISALEWLTGVDNKFKKSSVLSEKVTDTSQSSKHSPFIAEFR